MEEAAPRILAYFECPEEMEQSRNKVRSQRCRLGTGGLVSEKNSAFRTRNIDVQKAPVKLQDLVNKKAL